MAEWEYKAMEVGKEPEGSGWEQTETFFNAGDHICQVWKRKVKSERRRSE